MNGRTKKQRFIQRERIRRARREESVHAVCGRSIPVWRRLLRYKVGRNAAPLCEGSAYYHRQYRARNRNRVPYLPLEETR